MSRYVYVFLFVWCLVGIPGIAEAQKVFKVKYESQADLKVFIVKYESQCDLKVYMVDYESQADEHGLWYVVDYESQAEKKIYFVEYESQADLKIFIVKYESQAGWRTLKNNTCCFLNYRLMGICTSEKVRGGLFKYIFHWL